MRRGLACLTILLLFLCAMPSLYGADESESTHLMETQGTPYQEEAAAPSPEGGAIIIDFLLVRPVSLAGLVIGTGLAIAATPFALASGSTGTVYEKLVVEPFDFAIRRPLGEF